MAKVIILNHGNFTDRKRNVEFKEALVTVNGVRQFLGVAEVPLDVAVQYEGTPSLYQVEYTEAEHQALHPDEDETVPPLGEGDDWYKAEDLEKLTVKQLKTLAKQEDIELPAEANLKGEIIQVIVDAGAE